MIKNNSLMVKRGAAVIAASLLAIGLNACNGRSDIEQDAYNAGLVRNYYASLAQCLNDYPISVYGNAAYDLCSRSRVNAGYYVGPWYSLVPSYSSYSFVDLPGYDRFYLYTPYSVVHYGYSYSPYTAGYWSPLGATWGNNVIVSHRTTVINYYNTSGGLSRYDYSRGTSRSGSGITIRGYSSSGRSSYGGSSYGSSSYGSSSNRSSYGGSSYGSSSSSGRSSYGSSSSSGRSSYGSSSSSSGRSSYGSSSSSGRSSYGGSSYGSSSSSGRSSYGGSSYGSSSSSGRSSYGGSSYGSSSSSGRSSYGGSSSYGSSSSGRSSYGGKR